MSINGYIGVADKARRTKKAYIGVDGKARRVLKMYIGDANGKARLWYEAEKRYSWERWNAVEVVSYAPSVSSDTQTITLMQWIQYPVSSDIAVSDSGEIILVNSEEVNVAAYYANSVYLTKPYLRIPEEEKYFKVEKMREGGWGAYTATVYAVTVTSSTTYTKGTTSYGTVTSTNANAYPTNGRASDGYWYVFVGEGY